MKSPINPNSSKNYLAHQFRLYPPSPQSVSSKAERHRVTRFYREEPSIAPKKFGETPISEVRRKLSDEKKFEEKARNTLSGARNKNKVE